MYDTIIIGAGMSGLGGRDSARPFRSARLHSGKAHDDRRAKFVLPTSRAKLRRRAARRDERDAEGNEKGSARATAAATCVSSGTTSRLTSATRFGDRVPRAHGCGSTTTPRRSAAKSVARFPIADRSTSIDWSSQIVDYDDLDASHAQYLCARTRRFDHHRTTLGRDAFLPAACSTAPPANVTWIGGSSRSCFAAFSWKASAARTPACG